MGIHTWLRKLPMRIAAMKEMQMKAEAEKPPLQMVLEINGDRMDPAVESTPHANAMIFSSTYEGAIRMMTQWTQRLAGVSPRSKLVRTFLCVRRVDVFFQKIHGLRLKMSLTSTLRLPLL